MINLKIREVLNLNLERIEQQLLHIEEKLENANVKDLQKLEEKLQKKIKYLKHKKDFFKEDATEYEKIKYLISKAKKLRRQVIVSDIVPMEKIETVEHISILEDLQQLENLKQVMKEDLSLEEKKQKIEEQVEIAQYKIDILVEQNRILQIIKKENLEKLKDFKSVHENLNEIRENIRKITVLKDLIQRCKSYLIFLKNEKVVYHHQKSERIKEEKSNDYYYLILEECRFVKQK